MSKLESITRCAVGTAVVTIAAAGTTCSAAVSGLSGYSALNAAKNGEHGLMLAGLTGLIGFGYVAYRIGRELPAIVRTFRGKDNYNGR